MAIKTAANKRQTTTVMITDKLVSVCKQICKYSIT